MFATTDNLELMLAIVVIIPSTPRIPKTIRIVVSWVMSPVGARYSTLDSLLVMVDSGRLGASNDSKEATMGLTVECVQVRTGQGLLYTSHRKTASRVLTLNLVEVLSLEAR